MTLVEILFAFAIISSVITIAYAAGLRAWRTAQAGNQRTQAQYIAQDALERVKAYIDTPNFQWSASRSADNLPGTGGFLQDIDHLGVSSLSAPDTKDFYIELCDPIAQPSCTYRVANASEMSATLSPATGQSAFVKPPADMRLTDNTDYYVYIRATQHYRFDPANVTITNTVIDGFPDLGLIGDATTIQSLTLEARVEWTSATNVPSNASASTIVTQNGIGQ